MKILVTGGSGFIGSHLIDRLLDRGEQVVCIDNMSLGNSINLSYALEHSNFKLYIEDLLNYHEIEKVFRVEQFEMVYHLAANSDIQLGYNNISTDYKNTLLTTYNILSCMKNFDVGKLVFASSSAIYGDHDNPLSENSGPLEPVSNYGAAKLASEAFISSFSTGYGMKSWVIRFPNIIGPRLTHGVIYDFLNKLKQNSNELLILGNGKQKKPYLFVTDLLNAIDLIVKLAEKTVNIFNVAPNSLSTVDFIANSIISALNLENVTKKYSGGNRGWVGDVPKFQYDTTKISMLGWKPTFTSDEAIIKSIREEIEFRK